MPRADGRGIFIRRVMSKRHGWLSPDVVDGHETTCISLNIPNDMAHRAAFWGAITELARDHNWDTGGDEQKAADLATYWRHLIFEGLTEDCSMAGVVDVRLNGQALEKTFDGETWEQFATIQQITSAVAETLPPGENATISLVDGVLTIGIPRGADGAIGLPGENGASVELRVDNGWVQWRQSDDNPTWTNLFEIPAGGGGEPFEHETETIWTGITLLNQILAEPSELLAFVADQSGEDLEIVIEHRGTANVARDGTMLFFNGDTALANYQVQATNNTSNTAMGAGYADQPIMAGTSGLTAPAGYYDTTRIYIAGYSRNDRSKIADITSVYRFAASNSHKVDRRSIHWESNAPITSLVMRTDNHPTDLFAAGTRMTVIIHKPLTVVTEIDGGGMFKGDTGAPGADGTDGTDGREIEMQAVQDENGVCQAIQWRYIGDAEWVTLVNTPVCEEPPAPPQNLHMNRCGVAAALTNELERLYTRVKLDPTLWDTLEGWAATVESGAQTTVLAAGLVTAIVGGSVAAGVGVFGSVLAGAAAFLRMVFNNSNSGVNEWTVATTEHLTSALYCVLSRRETVTITADVLREWVSFAADAPINNDNDVLISLIAVVPVSYWANEAAVAQPDINSCLDPCATREGQWCTEIGSLGSGSLHFDDPIVRATSSILIGRVDWDTPFHLEAVPTPLDTLLYSITLNFGRNIILGGLDIGATFMQSVDTTSPAIIVTDNLGRSLGQTDVTGITDPFGDEITHRWRASETTQLSSITITGKVAVADADSITNEMLRIDYIRLCGDGYAPYGEAGNNCAGCDPYNPCLDGPDYGTDHCYSWDFLSSDGGWSAPTFGGTQSAWAAGQGWKSALRSVGADQTDELRLNLGFTNSFNRSLVRIEIDAEFSLGQIQFSGFERGNFVITDPSTSTTLFNQAGPWNGVRVDDTPPAANTFRSGMNITAIASQRTSGTPNPRGEIVLRRITVWYNGDDANFTGGSGS